MPSRQPPGWRRYGGIMRLRHGFAIVGIVAIGALALAGESPFSHGVVRHSCAPWDGPAVEVTLTTSAADCDRVSEPYVSMGVWRGLRIHDGQVVKFDTKTDAGFASRCRKAGECQRAESGTIVFDKYEDGSGARGHYELQFKGGESLSGSFDVGWCKTSGMCR